MTLSLGGELRLRSDSYVNSAAPPVGTYTQRLFRGLVHSELRVGSHWRAFVELGTADLDGQRSAMPANFRNEASLQQAFVEYRGHVGNAMVGAIVGRQEYADGPPQLVSVGDGPSLRRTYNGARLFAHAPQWRIGAFDFEATDYGFGGFGDDRSDEAERFSGVTGAVSLSGDSKAPVVATAYWIRFRADALRYRGRAVRAERDTAILRLQARRGPLTLDASVARQTGVAGSVPIEAYGAFGVASWQFDEPLRPRVGVRFDLATGGRSGDFDQLYASSAYISEGLFVGLSNMVQVTPTLALAPARNVSLVFDYGRAWRYSSAAPAYGGLMRPYAGTQGQPGARVGDLARANIAWDLSDTLRIYGVLEAFRPGPLLQRTGRERARYSAVGISFRY